jgi:hypothetical protein
MILDWNDIAKEELLLFFNYSIHRGPSEQRQFYLKRLQLQLSSRISLGRLLRWQLNRVNVAMMSLICLTRRARKHSPIASAERGLVRWP